MIDNDAILKPEFISSPTPLKKTDNPFLKDYGINLFVKLEYLNNPWLSGNKWHKLKYNLLAAKEDGKDTLLTFGGAFSNHIYATAAAGKLFHFKTIGIIRGEEHLPLNPTLTFAKNAGMKIHYVNRKTYRNKTDSDFIISLKKKFGDFYLIPEGGTNKLAVKGVSELIKSIDIDFDFICTACGTGGTLAGLAAGLKGEKYALGFSVLKGASFLSGSVQNLLNNNANQQFNNWRIILDYHFGGYAKISKELISFIDEFEKENDIPIEPIYTGKMFYGIYDLIRKGFFKKGQTIIALHTGGLQGLEGMNYKIKKLFLRNE